jgi:hypothetical protein
MYGVMSFSQLHVHRHEPGCDQFQAALFEPRNYFTDQASLYTIRLDEHQRSFHADLLAMVLFS